MYRFIIRSVDGKAIYTSIRKFDEVSQAQLEGFKFLILSKMIGNRYLLSSKTNYVDVIN